MNASLEPQPDPIRATGSTIPVLRIFDEDQARRFYVDFLGCTLDFGGPSGGEGTPFYGQVSRAWQMSG